MQRRFNHKCKRIKEKVLQMNQKILQVKRKCILEIPFKVQITINFKETQIFPDNNDH